MLSGEPVAHQRDSLTERLGLYELKPRLPHTVREEVLAGSGENRMLQLLDLLKHIALDKGGVVPVQVWQILRR